MWSLHLIKVHTSFLFFHRSSKMGLCESCCPRDSENSQQVSIISKTYYHFNRVVLHILLKPNHLTNLMLSKVEHSVSWYFYNPHSKCCQKIILLLLKSEFILESNQVCSLVCLKKWFTRKYQQHSFIEHLFSRRRRTEIVRD